MKTRQEKTKGVGRVEERRGSSQVWSVGQPETKKSGNLRRGGGIGGKPLIIKLSGGKCGTLAPVE